MSEVYISVDVETDGPIPGPYSMLSIGAAAFLPSSIEDHSTLGTFSMNLCRLDGAVADPDTMKWWATQPKAWDACRQDPRDPAFAMGSFTLWVQEMTVLACECDGTPAKPVFVGYPAGFDFLFVYWYLIKFTGQSPFSFSALDIKSFAMARTGLDYRQVNKKTLARFAEPGREHTHVAVDDAIEQGYLFLNLLRDRP